MCGDSGSLFKMSRGQESDEFESSLKKTSLHEALKKKNPKKPSFPGVDDTFQRKLIVIYL